MLRFLVGALTGSAFAGALAWAFWPAPVSVPSPPAVQEQDEAAPAAEAAQYWLRRTIEVESGVLSARSDEDRIRALREWTYSAVNRSASDVCLLEEAEGYGIYERPASEVLYIAHKRGLGYFCGGTADLLADIYAMFGYPSGGIDVGVPDRSATHVATLVELPSGIVSLQDAYLGNELVSETGELADFGEFARAMLDGTAERFSFRDGENRCKPLVGLRDEWRSLETLVPYEIGVTVAEYEDRLSRCHKLTAETWDAVAPYFYEVIREATGKSSPVYLYSLPLGATGIARDFVTCRQWGDCTIAASSD